MSFICKFLSHLSGDEEAALSYSLAIDFLSHLSGDEVGCFLNDHTVNFLSHLSGDEGRALRFKDQG